MRFLLRITRSIGSPAHQFNMADAITGLQPPWRAPGVTVHDAAGALKAGCPFIQARPDRSEAPAELPVYRCTHPHDSLQQAKWYRHHSVGTKIPDGDTGSPQPLVLSASARSADTALPRLHKPSSSGHHHTVLPGRHIPRTRPQRDLRPSTVQS